MGQLKITGSRVQRGGQHVGTGPSRMRVEYLEEGETMVAIEMYVPPMTSQHKARQAAIGCIDLLLEELRLPPRTETENQ